MTAQQREQIRAAAKALVATWDTADDPPQEVFDRVAALIRPAVEATRKAAA
jgi:hypothetical protein